MEGWHMGYMHINNLYKEQEILAFRECFAMEKIHGTSAHISWKEDKLTFFSGGESHDKFVALFDQEALIARFKETGVYNVTVYGEAYGGKQQAMSATYGPTLKFVAFDVKIDEVWLAVPRAEKFVDQLGLEFVDYVKIPTTIEAVDAERDKDSVQAIRNGMGEGKKREGVVLRPPFEVRKNNNGRVMSKHKRDDFSETATPRKVVDPEKMKVLEDAKEVATEWVTEMRLMHVLDKIEDYCIEKMGIIIKAMVEDIKREGEGEIVWSGAVQKAISKDTAILAKRHFQNQLKKDNAE
jgi:hypothetical protein